MLTNICKMLIKRFSTPGNSGVTMAAQDPTSFSPLRIYTSPDEHGRELIQGLHEHYKQGLYTDYTIMLANGKTILCHRTVLAAKVPFFKAMFTTGKVMKEGSANETKLDHIDPYCAEALVEYCYSGTMVVPWDKIKDMVNTAEFMQVMVIKDECDDFIQWKVKHNDAKDWYKFACTYQLRNTCRLICSQYLEKITMLTEFLEVSGYELFDRILSDYDCEEDRFKSVILLKAFLKWVMHKPAKRHIEWEISNFFHKMKSCSKEMLNIILNDLNRREKAILNKYPDAARELGKYATPRHRKSHLVFIGPKHESDAPGPVVTAWYFDTNLNTDDYNPWVNLCSVGWHLQPSMCRQMFDMYNVCAIPSGFVIVGGAFNIFQTGDMCGTMKEFYPSPYCHFFKPTNGNYEENDYYILPAMSTARYRHGCEYVNNTVYVFGGFTADPRCLETAVSYNFDMDQDELNSSKSVEGMDIDTKNWLGKADMPHAIRDPISVAVGHEIYVVGMAIVPDLLDSHAPSSFVKYNTVTNTWQELPEPPFRFYHDLPYSALYHQGKIYCIANEEGYKRPAQSYFVWYDTEGHVWGTSRSSRGRPPRMGKCCFFKFNNRMWFFGTLLDKTQEEMWKYSEEDDKWQKSYLELELPPDFTSHHNHAFSFGTIKVLEIEMSLEDFDP